MAENPRIEELRRRVQADPASIAFAALAEEFRRGGRYDDAIQTCRTGLVRHPAYLSARVTLGRALIETGEYDAARKELEMVLRSAPENIAARRGLEEIKERQGSSTPMAPEVAALATPAASAAPARAPEPIRPSTAPSIDLSALDLPLAPPPPILSEPSVDEAFDIFAAALDRSVAPADTPAPEPAAKPLPSHMVELPPDLFEPAPAEEPELPAVASEPEVIASAAPPEAIEPPPAMAFESATVAFVAPVVVAVAVPEPEPEPEAELETGPDPDVAAAVMRLERFLGAIQTARHA